MRNYIFIICILAEWPVSYLVAQTFGYPSVALNNNVYKDESVYKEQARQFIKGQPVKFIENRGQLTDNNGRPVPFVFFKASAQGVDMYVTEKGLIYVFVKVEEEDHIEGKGEVAKAELCIVNMNLNGADIQRENIIKEGASVTDINFFLSHCSNGITGVKEFEQVIIKNVYPGIDWVLYSSSEKGFKYDFVVNPGADHNLIQLDYSSPEPLRFNSKGGIQLKTKLGTLQEDAPLSFQNGNQIGTKFIKTYDQHNKCGGYDTRIQFALSGYDRRFPLTIDPQLWWATGYGGNAHDGPTSVKCDADGNVIVAGYGAGNNTFPLFNAGVYYQTTSISWEGFILKFNSSGVRLWATYYGGSGSDIFYCATIDLNNNIYVTGVSDSPDFPLKNSGGYFQSVQAGGQDGVILKFDNSGNRLWATYYGGSADEFGGQSITTDASGNVFVVGNTTSTNLPLLNPGVGAYFQGIYAGGNITNYTYAGGDAFILKFDNTQTLKWATYYGGSGLENCFSVTVDIAGSAFICGYTGSANLPVKDPGGGAYFNNTLAGTFDGYISKFSNAGVLQWATYYGGSGNDWAMALTTDINNNLFVLGYTGSSNLPLQNPGGTSYYDGTLGGIYDAFVLKFNNAGARQWATYYGGSGDEITFLLSTYKYVFEPDAHIVVDVCNNIYAAFETFSTDIATYNPACGSFYDGSLNNAGSAFNNDILLAKFDNTGSLLWATYWGSSLTDFREGLATDLNGSVYMVGEWYQSTGTNYITADPGGGAYYDATPNGANEPYIAKFIPTLPVYTQNQVNPGLCICNGTATVTVACGTPPFNYVWSSGSQTLNANSNTNTITGLCSGNYSVKVTDSNCNINSTTINYILPGGSGSVSLSSTQNNVSCTGFCNGSATIAASGGTSPYTYSWSNGQTALTASGLCVGTYSVVATDVGNCTSVQSINITQPSKLALGFSTNWSCSANKATVTVSPANGTPPYVYLWNNSQTTSTVSGLNAGTYSVTVTDSKGCTATGSIIAENIPPVIAASITNNTCNANGSIIVKVSGVSPVMYSWSSGHTAATYDNPAPGIYTVTVTDGNGCVATKTFSVTNNSPVSATFTNSPTACTGTNVNFTNTGTTGGTTTYSWTIGAPANVSGTTNDFSYAFLTTGTYSITHQVFSGGCLHTITGNVTIINCTGGPTVTTNAASVCPGSCITVTSSSVGGATPYTYSWSTGYTAQNINVCPVSTTTYTLTVKDASGNTSTSTAVVTANPAVNATIASTNITCNGNANGSASASVGGGTSPFTFNWSSGQITQTATGLSAGNYTITITDSKGCTATSSAGVISPPALTGQFTKGTANCAGCGCKEWIMITGTGGTSPYSYTWPDGYVNRYKNQLCPGAYTVNIKDKNGCSVTVNFTTP
ncbi:MAG: SBBP repeat-containing protein [Bacteroidetes bacterium]|nr:SBBP repeat-containing protein [Bacteroidota bacterium]